MKMTKRANTWKKEVSKDDLFICDPKETDLVIPVMGPTGAGKSTFINTLLGRDVASVGHDLRSHTAQIHHYVFSSPDYPQHRIVIIDTPGFDDTNVDDREILRRIAVWLARSYDANMKLAGVIYLHEITQTRMLGTARRNLDMFNKLCGPDASKNIMLVTNKWNDVRPDVGARREQQLRDNHWKDMLRQGSQLLRFEHTPPSAEHIVHEILSRNAVNAIQIQQELVLIDKLLAETEAGRTLRYTLKELLETQKKMATQLRQDGGDELQQRVVETETKIAAILHQIKGLNIPLSRKFMRWFRLTWS